MAPSSPYLIWVTSMATLAATRRARCSSSLQAPQTSARKSLSRQARPVRPGAPRTQRHFNFVFAPVVMMFHREHLPATSPPFEPLLGPVSRTDRSVLLLPSIKLSASAFHALTPTCSPAEHRTKRTIPTCHPPSTTTVQTPSGHQVPPQKAAGHQDWKTSVVLMTSARMLRRSSTPARALDGALRLNRHRVCDLLGTPPARP